MFNNSVLNPDVNTVKWAKAAGLRALKTFCQTAATLIGAECVTVYLLDWKFILGASATSAIVSLLTSVYGIPEVPETKESEGE